MSQKEKSFLDSIGKLNFSFFYHVVKAINLNWSRKFLYLGLEDKSIYESSFTDPSLNLSVLGKNFPSPLGIASGFDNSFKYNDTLIQYGFGFEEFGTFTINPMHKPARLKFLRGQQSCLVSQSVFENNGLSFLQKALINRRHLPYIAGISISSNTELKEEEAERRSVFGEIQKELIEMTQRTAPYCDYIVLNLSHPHLTISSLLTNTTILEDILTQMKYAISKVAPITKPKLLVKLPPHILPKDVLILADTFLNVGIDGIIISGYLNDIKQLERLAGKNVSGFISGKAISDISTKLIAAFYRATQGKLLIIASGGVFTGEAAFEKIQNGATLVQLHSAILFKGPGIANEISKNLVSLLKKNNFQNISQAIGYKVKDII